ncbi:MFS transporter [Rhodobacterales bacterium]|nr:MFS transporter [Rhodobacterales bacterium]
MSRKTSSISTRVAALFASHFFGYGLFLPFFPVVLGFRGLSAAEIGFILGAGTIARIAASPILSNLSDRTGQRRVAILIYSLAAAVFMALYAVPGGVIVLSVCVIGYMVCKAPLVPLSDAYALDVARNTGADYARMRLWGSAGFVAATLVGGGLTSQSTSWIIILLIAAASLNTGAVAMSLPRQKRGDKAEGDSEGDRPSPFRTVWFWLLIALFGLFQGSHSAFYGFGTLYWQAKHIPDFAIGVLWAIGVIAEIGLFAVAKRLSNRFDPSAFLIAAGIASVVRWGLFPLADTVVAMGALQVLHGLSFGAAHLGSVAILARIVPSRWAGTGQGFLATSIGLQMAVGLGISGALYEVSHDAPFYLMTAIAVVGTVLTIAMTPTIRRKTV